MNQSTWRRLYVQSTSSIKTRGRLLGALFGELVARNSQEIQKGDLFVLKQGFSECRIEINDLPEISDPMKYSNVDLEINE